jgi:hypothetical protein
MTPVCGADGVGSSDRGARAGGPDLGIARTGGKVKSGVQRIETDDAEWKE